jgi:hypothetical protein
MTSNYVKQELKFTLFTAPPPPNKFEQLHGQYQVQLINIAKSKLHNFQLTIATTLKFVSYGLKNVTTVLFYFMTNYYRAYQVS